MLSDKYNYSNIQMIDFPVKDYEPLPKQGSEKWKKINPDVTKMWVEAAEKYLDYKWPPITPEMYIAPKRTGLLSAHWGHYRELRSALGTLAVAEYLEGKGRFLDQVINGVITTCQETAWIQGLGMSVHGYDIPDDSNHEVDLCTSETAAMLSWIMYLLGDAVDGVSKRVRARVRRCVRERIIDTYLNRDDYWWMGFTDDRTNNWNPWCNLNVIMCVLLTEDDPDIIARVIYKVFRSLDKYVEAYSEDGCCDEGPMYWGAAGGGLFLCLEMLYEASGGAIDVFDNEKMRLIGQYITKVFIDGEYYVSYADGDAFVQIGSTVYRYGKAINDEGMMKLGKTASMSKPAVFDWFKPYQILLDAIRDDITPESYEPPASGTGYYPLQSYLFKTGVMNARENEGSPKGFFLSAKAGNNVESHNHNDLGNFIVYYNGKPLFVDIGTEEYSVKTFSPERYEIWYIRSDYHNCMQVSGVDQHEGWEYYTEDVNCIQTDDESILSMELKNAYPEQAGILSWKRSIALKRNHEKIGNGIITINDAYSLTGIKPVNKYLITPTKPELSGEKIKLIVDDEIITVTMKSTGIYKIIIEETPALESRLIRNWGENLYRIIFIEEVSAGETELIIQRESTGNNIG